MSNNESPAAGGPNKWLSFLLPLVLGVAGAWGANQFLSGTTQQRISTLEDQIKGLKEEQQRMMSRQEMKTFMDQATQNLKDIREDIREIRNSRR